VRHSLPVNQTTAKTQTAQRPKTTQLHINANTSTELVLQARREGLLESALFHRHCFTRADMKPGIRRRVWASESSTSSMSYLTLMSSELPSSCAPASAIH